MSQAQPPFNPPPYQPMPAPVARTNGWAIASLICGILGCIPAVTSLLAVFFAVLGIRKSRQPMTGGKGLAIAGLVLGIIGILGWGAAGGGMYTLSRHSAKPRAVAEQFARNLSTGNVNAAVAQCEPGMPRETLDSASQSLSQLGAIKTITLFGINVNAAGGVSDWVVAGAMSFDQGTKKYEVTLRSQGEDYKVVKFKFE